MDDMPDEVYEEAEYQAMCAIRAEANEYEARPEPETEIETGTVYQTTIDDSDAYKAKIQKAIIAIKNTASRVKNEKARAALMQIATADTPSETEYKQWLENLPPDSPCHSWSLTNQLVIILSGSAEARGFVQWKNAGRKIKKGTKSIYITVPAKKQNGGIYFKELPVFKLEDTEPTQQPTTADQAA